MFKKICKNSIIILMTVLFFIIMGGILGSKVQAVQYTINPSTKTIEKGKTADFTLFKDGKRFDGLKKNIKWKFDSKIVEMSAYAKNYTSITLKGLKEGTTKVSALISGKEVSSAKLTIKKSTPIKYTIKQTKNTINVEEIATFTVLKNGKSFDALGEKINWKFDSQIVRMVAYAKDKSTITLRGLKSGKTKVSVLSSNKEIAKVDLEVKDGPFTGWKYVYDINKDDIYYKNGTALYKRGKDGYVVNIQNNAKVTAWIENIRYTNGKEDLIRQEDGTVVKYDTFKKVTRWVGNQFYKDGKLYAEIYNKTSKKVTADGLAYKVAYKDKNGKIDESKLVKNEFLGTKTNTTVDGKGFNTKGEMVFATSQGKAYVTEKGLRTDKLFSGKVDSLEFKNGVLLVNSSIKKEGWIGKSYYMDGKEVAKIINLRTYRVGDSTPKTILEDFVKVTKKDNITAWVGSKNYSYDSQKKETELRYINKSGIVYKADSNGAADITKPVTGWIFQEYYKNGKLVAGTYKEDKETLYSNGKAYTIKNGKADKIYTGFLGTIYFDKNGNKAAILRNEHLYVYKNGEETKELYKEEIKNVGEYLITPTWIGDKRYENVNGNIKIMYVRKNGIVYKANSNGQADTNNPASNWIGNEYYQRGKLRIAYKSDGKAYIVRNGKITNTLAQGWAGGKYFAKGELIKQTKN